MAARQNASAKDRRWRPFCGVDRHALSEARLQAHHALQWLGRVGSSYVPPQPDYGHTNLGWDDALDGFTTHPLQDGARPIFLSPWPLGCASTPVVGRATRHARP